MTHTRDALVRHRSAGQSFVAASVRSYALDDGDGEPIVCLHGVPVSCFVYRKVVAALAERGLRGIAFDFPGTGLAERPARFDYSWTGLGRWTVAAVDALGLDRFHLVVHDIGGPIGFEAAAAVGDRIRSLTMLNTVTDPAAFRTPWVMRPFTVPVLDRIWLHGTPDRMFVAMMRWQGVANRAAVSDGELLAHRRLLTAGDGGRAFLRIMRGDELTEAKSTLYRTTIRSIAHRQIIWGDRDPALRYRPYGETAVAVADIDEVTRLPAKHFLQEDHGAQIADLVARLVARASS